MPEEGLKSVETLVIKDTPRLKKLPPIMAFQNLQTAHLNYNHHCCLMKKVEPKWQTRDAEKYMTPNIDLLRRKFCSDLNSSAILQSESLPVGPIRDSGDVHDDGFQLPPPRLKRAIVGLFVSPSLQAMATLFRTGSPSASLGRVPPGLEESSDLRFVRNF